MVSVKVENLVARAKIAEGFDLQKVADSLIGSVYSPDQFEGVLYKLLSPKAAFLILKNGKVVCTGLTSMEDVQEAYEKLRELLDQDGIDTLNEYEIESRNVVASLDLAQEVDLEVVRNGLGDDSEYDPDLLPAVIYHLSEPRASALIFSNGKLVVTGPKSIEETKKAVAHVLSTLSGLGVVVV